ncbi:MAG: cation:proton antiporter [Anaerolineales bacterium]|nr:cation:proton antiporter [Anaerolineales bacterium]MCB9126651.1 cation:proton antiporter [Ardenticatenales bacterium]MCB9172723.1 cation:proton antiporter [Ardenticatenales bacterium]
MDTGAFALLSLTILAFSLVSKRLEMSLVTPPMVFTLVGIALGVLGAVHTETESELIKLLAEFTLILVLFTDAMRLDFSAFRAEYNLAARLLGIGLPLTIALGAIVAFYMFPELGLLEAALLASVLAPTDAALGLAVVSNPRVPVRIRQTLNVESGLNDGIALTVVLFFIAAVAAEGAGRGSAEWVNIVTLQLVLGPLIGGAVGFAGASVIDNADEKGWISPVFSRISTLALALLAYSLAEMAGSNGFISVFVAGILIGYSSKGRVCRSLFVFVEAEGQLLTLLVFIAFGATMVVPFWDAFTWRTLAYALLSLTLIRMLPASLSLFGTGLRWQTVHFLSWFGPRGIASIIYGLLLYDEGLPQSDTLFPTIVLTVLLSTFLHGMSAAPLADLYGKAIERIREHEEHPELQVVPELPLRH